MDAVREPGQVISAEKLFETVWGEKYLDRNNTVMVHIRRLREKMGEPGRSPRFIKTVWGVGYKIDLNGNQKSFSKKFEKSVDKQGGVVYNNSCPVRRGYMAA